MLLPFKCSLQLRCLSWTVSLSHFWQGGKLPTIHPPLFLFWALSVSSLPLLSFICLHFFLESWQRQPSAMFIMRVSLTEPTALKKGRQDWIRDSALIHQRILLYIFFPHPLPTSTGTHPLRSSASSKPSFKACPPSAVAFICLYRRFFTRSHCKITTPQCAFASVFCTGLQGWDFTACLQCSSLK